jgi:hypothetical protein
MLLQEVDSISLCCLVSGNSIRGFLWVSLLIITTDDQEGGKLICHAV